MNNIEVKLANLRTVFKIVHSCSFLSGYYAFDGLKEKVRAFSGNTYFEELTSVCFYPELNMLEAFIAAKHDCLYSDGSETDGAYAFVRFYINYGQGWEDQGYAAAKNYSISARYHYNSQSEKPVSCSASLKIVREKLKNATYPRPKVRAVLEWYIVPPVNEPDYNSIWGNTVDDHIGVVPGIDSKIIRQ